MFWSQQRAFALIPVFIIIIISSFIISKLLANKDEKTRMLPVKIVTIILLVMEFFKQLLSIIRGYDLYHIPLHFCSLFLYFLPLAVFYNGKHKDIFRTLAGVISACLFLFMSVYPLLIYPDSDMETMKIFLRGEDIYRYFQFHSVIFHNVALLAFFLLAFSNVLKHDTKKDIKVIIIAFAIYAIIAGSLANLIDTNFNNFRSCNADFLENVRLSLVNSMAGFGQFIYVVIIAIGTIIVPILSYLVLKLFEKIYNKVEIGLNSSFVLAALVALGLIISIFNKGLGLFVCSIFLVVLLSSAIPTLFNSIKEKKMKYILFSSIFTFIGLSTMILEFVLL
ncbi:MAG: YwaF family protein [Bacilli bacterium]|nr:YwaF family protein [Bacilli bacterium]